MYHDKGMLKFLVFGALGLGARSTDPGTLSGLASMSIFAAQLGFKLLQSLAEIPHHLKRFWHYKVWSQHVG